MSQTKITGSDISNTTTLTVGNTNINGIATLQGNLVLGNSSVAVGVQANGSYGTSGQILTSNGTATYWGIVPASVSGSNTQIQFNDSGSLNASASFIFDKTSNTVSIGNSSVNTVINSSSITVKSIVWYIKAHLFFKLK